MKRSDDNMSILELISLLVALCGSILSLTILGQAYITYITEHMRYGQCKFENYYIILPLVLGALSFAGALVLWISLRKRDYLDDGDWIRLWAGISSVLSYFAFIFSVISALVHIF